MPRKKTGPKGPRVGRRPELYTRLRKSEQDLPNETEDSSEPVRRGTASRAASDAEQYSHFAEALSENPDARGAFEPSPLLSAEIIRRCVDGFFSHKYPLMPFLDSRQVYASLPQLGKLPEQYGLITALCAVVILQPEILSPQTLNSTHGDKIPSANFFTCESLRARKRCDYVENPTLVAIQISFFLFAAMFAIGKDQSAWFYIREAINLLQSQRLHEEATYLGMADANHAIYCRRMFWQLFITEKAYALQRHRPLTLQRTIALPIIGHETESAILSGFIDLVSLFEYFDESFLLL